MPPINSQGSRAGLITALVVFTILFVLSTVFAIQFYGNYQKATITLDGFQQRYKDVISVDPSGSKMVTDLLEARTTPKFKILPGDGALEVAVKQRDALGGIIAGPANSVNPATIVDLASKQIDQANSTLKNANISLTLPPGSNLATSIVAVAKAAADAQAAGDQLKIQKDQTQKDLTKANADLAAVADQGKTDVSKALESAKADLATATKANSDKDDAIKALQDNLAAAIATAATAAQQSATDLNGANQQIAKLNKSVQEFQTKMAQRRADVISPLMRQGDGKIVRVPNKEVCYINLGFGDQVTPGLTFEVYDKAEGVPGIPPGASGDEELPVGKGSIEITKVGTTSSECRIVNITPGAVISEGDIIANLVYDVHTKYNFFVYGNFDLAGNGRPNAPDADVMKRLVTQWGGKLIDVVNVDTDFVVLGAEPVLPIFSKDDAVTAENQKKLDDAQKALDAYQEIRQQAKDLHIPILNQNRFLYYVGFYDQAKR